MSLIDPQVQGLPDSPAGSAQTHSSTHGWPAPTQAMRPAKLSAIPLGSSVFGTNYLQVTTGEQTFIPPPD